jgi:uncharacterized protein (DUF2235 family)
MTKRIVIACDGTWNHPDQVKVKDKDRNEVKKEEVTPTNVVKLALGLSPQDAEGHEQVVFYERGVGTGGLVDRLGGGAVGIGLSRNVQSPYAYLAQTYEPGDVLYLFGFSRGAYTARSLAGLINNCGILRPEHADRIDDAYKLYRDTAAATLPSGNEARLFRRTYAQEDRTKIRLLGVWDTVGALGVPVPAPVPKALRKWLTQSWSFHDMKLGSQIEHAVHALAIDERRRPFEPTPMLKQKDAPPQQTLEQVWFAGVHSDVGGSYRDPDLADITLLWMADHARNRGLVFRDGWFTRTSAPTAERRATGQDVSPDALGAPHDSMTLPYRLLRPLTRDLSAAPGSRIASSVERRLAADVCEYDPPNVAGHLIDPVPVTDAPG